MTGGKPWWKKATRRGKREKERPVKKERKKNHKQKIKLPKKPQRKTR